MEIRPLKDLTRDELIAHIYQLQLEAAQKDTLIAEMAAESAPIADLTIVDDPDAEPILSARIEVLRLDPGRYPLCIDRRAPQ